MTELEAFYKDKTILVTGGCGSIGSNLVRRLLEFDPRVIRIFDNNEAGIYELEQDLQSNKIRPLIGDLRSKSRLKRAVDGVNILLHAAALKHVPLCEFNAFEAVQTNVNGTQNVIDAALESEIDQVMLISTDKAVNPRNVMGATKLLAERLMISANYYKGSRKTAFSCVRFGNVLNSRGSVVPLFAKQMRERRCITITDTSMTRFVMSISQAVDLILEATMRMRGGEIFVLKMPAVNITDLARAVIEELGPSCGVAPEDVVIKCVGKRPGEKMYEELMTDDEAECATEMNGLYVIELDNPVAQTEGSKANYTSCFSTRLSEDEIRKILRERFS
jgi:FlaA1/EpsC-like NDP-sugar epimerase